MMLQAGYRQADVASKMKISSGRAYYLVKNSRSMDLNKVKEYVIKLGDLDYKIKSGQIDIKQGFEFFYSDCKKLLLQELFTLILMQD